MCGRKMETLFIRNRVWDLPQRTSSSAKIHVRFRQLNPLLTRGNLLSVRRGANPALGAHAIGLASTSRGFLRTTRLGKRLAGETIIEHRAAHAAHGSPSDREIEME